MKSVDADASGAQIAPVDYSALAAECLRRCDQISLLSEHPGAITRRFLTPAIKETHDQIGRWMAEMGLSVHLDDAGNLIGRRGGTDRSSKTLLIGSHLDTVPDGGKYDGLLGVLIGLAVIDSLRKTPLPFNIDVIGFSEEEGVRFATPYLGSHAIAGAFDPAWLDRVDDCGESMRTVIEAFGLRPERIPQAAYVPSDVIGFVEPHIEQGPMLADVDRPVGIVDSIAGQSRLLVRLTGNPGHAGTSPMPLRKDALVAAARWVVEVSQYARGIDGLRATVGHVEVVPNARNVIPGRVDLSLDIRHREDAIRCDAVSELCRRGIELAEPESIRFEVIQEQSQPAVKLDDRLGRMLGESMVASGVSPYTMFSGAGHDAVAVAATFPTAMLFLRQPSGISHHPDEDVSEPDVVVAIEVMNEFVRRLAAQIRGRETSST